MTDEGDVSPENNVTPEPAAEVAPISVPESVPDAVVTPEPQEVTEPAQPEPAPEVVVEPTLPATVGPAPVPEPPAPETPPEPPRPTPVPPSPPPEPTQIPEKERKASSKNRMLEVVRARRAERLEKIVALAREKRVIKNDDVEKLLKVSDATVTNYLNALVLSARLRRSGYGRGAQYEPV